MSARIGHLFASALKLVLSDQAAVYDYDAPEDFKHLWNTRYLSDAKLSRAVVVWDGRQAPSSNDQDNALRNILAPHLTPLDWALSISIHAIQHKAKGITIHIVDLTGKDHDEWSFRARHQWLALMPWVTLHAPLIPESAFWRAGYRPISGQKRERPLLCQCDTFGKRQLTTCGALGTTGSGKLEDLKELMHAWSATVARTSDHHDLNNIVGPSVLNSSLPSDLWTKALMQKLVWAQFINVATTEFTPDDAPSPTASPKGA